MKLIQLVYASAADNRVTQEDIDAIIRVSVENNSANNITGMLMYADGSFLQVLEGEESAVEELFFNICTDKRHRDVVKIFQNGVSERNFDKWSMGLASMKNADLASIPGCEDFFQSGAHISAISESTARKVLQGFINGKWRRHIQ